MDTDKVSKSAVRLSFIIVVCIFFIALMYVAYRSDTADERIEKNSEGFVVNQQRIEKLTSELKKTVHEQCEESKAAARGVNTVLETLINAVTVTQSIPPSEKADRIKKYEGAKMKIPECKE